MTNILVTAMLLTGGSAVVTSLTGVPTPAACFLLPVGVVLYTIFGGSVGLRLPCLLVQANAGGAMARVHSIEEARLDSPAA